MHWITAMQVQTPLKLHYEADPDYMLAPEEP